MSAGPAALAAAPRAGARWVAPIWHGLLASLLFAFTLLVFTRSFHYVSSSDNAPAELLPISVLHEGDLDFDEFPEAQGELPYYLARVNGRVVSAYPIVAGLFNVPVYWLAASRGTDLYDERLNLSLWTAAGLAALSVAWMYLALRKVCPRPATAVLFALVYAFATVVWSVLARGLWQHTVSVLCLTLGLYLLLSGGRKRVALAGLVLAVVVAARPSNVMLALPLTVYVYRHQRAALPAYLALAALPAGWLAWYSYTYLGSPLALGQTIVTADLFGGNPLENLAGLLVSPSRGLLTFSPIFVLSLAGVFAALRDPDVEPIYRYLAAGAAGLLALLSLWSWWWGGHSFGYRIISELVPVLILFLALAWERLLVRRWYGVGLFVALLLVSLYIQLLGSYYYPCGADWVAGEPWRLWDVRDTTLTRCSALLYGDLLH